MGFPCSTFQSSELSGWEKGLGKVERVRVCLTLPGDIFINIEVHPSSHWRFWSLVLELWKSSPHSAVPSWSLTYSHRQTCGLLSLHSHYTRGQGAKDKPQRRSKPQPCLWEHCHLPNRRPDLVFSWHYHVFVPGPCRRGNGQKTE